MTAKVELFVETTSGDYFTLDDGTKGVLDGATYKLGGGYGAYGAPVDITDQCASVSTWRGRSSELERFTAGTCRVVARNYDRDFDPEWAMRTGTSPAGAYGDVRPGKRLRISDGSTVVWSGIVEDWDYDWRSDRGVDASFLAVDALGRLGQQRFREWTTTAQKPGDRITAVLDRAEVGWATGERDIDDGVNTLQSDLVSFGSNVLNYLQLVATSDFGRLYAAADDTLTFRDRHDVITAATAAQFGDEGGAQIPISRVVVDYGTEQLFTRVTIDRTGGVAQTAEADASLIAEYGHRPWRQSELLLSSDFDALELARHLRDKYDEPVARVAALVIILDTLSAGDRATVVGLDIGDVVTFDWTPTGTGAAIRQLLVIEGVGYESSYDGVTAVRLQLSDASDRAGFVLDDSTDGVLDTSALAF